MSRISKVFENDKALMAYITCGDPDLGTTTAIINEVVSKGVNIIGLGIPFSDPTAEGTIIQESNIRALAKGITTDDIFKYVSELRKDIEVPVIFMTYANVVFSYGSERFMRACKDCGADGILIADLPYEEREDFLPVCEEYGIELVSAIALNSADRVEMIAKDAKELIYIFSASEKDMDDNAAVVVENIRKVTNVPCIISYGTGGMKQMKKAYELADGVAASEDVMELLAQHGTESAEFIGQLVSDIKKIQAE